MNVLALVPCKVNGTVVAPTVNAAVGVIVLVDTVPIEAVFVTVSAVPVAVMLSAPVNVLAVAPD